jgi:hypothetical protein
MKWISPHGKRLVVATEIGVDVGNSEETSRYDGSANNYSQKLSTSKPTFERFGRQGRYTIWEDRLSELADYRKIQGTAMFLETTKKTQLANWVTTQRSKVVPRRKEIVYDSSRIQELESLGFEWSHGAAWKTV